ncbi:MAG TPA: hypothetical protein VK014_00325 [Cyclobacteriaceae bacterium]|nr:hypothetical protein [Cyclobacteriaceae bacterium]
MRKFKNNLRTELVNSYRKGWQRSIYRWEEQSGSPVVISCIRCLPSASGRSVSSATLSVRRRYNTES